MGRVDRPSAVRNLRPLCSPAITLTGVKLEQPCRFRSLAVEAWPSKDAADYANARRERRRLRDLPSKDPAYYARNEKWLHRWLDRHVWPSKNPDDYAVGERRAAWLISGPVRPPIVFYLIYVAAVGTSVARAYVDDGSDESEYLLYATIALFALSAIVLIVSHRSRWRKKMGLSK